MRKVLVVALGALALAGCVHHDRPYHGAGYDHAGYAYGYGYTQRTVVAYRPVHRQPVWRPVDYRYDWRDSWHDRRRDRYHW